jgi:hypothetical protein
VREPDSATLHRAHARWVTGEIGSSLLQKKFYTTLGLVELDNTDSFQTAEYFTMTLDPKRHLTCWQKHVHLTFRYEFDGFSPTILNFL